MVMRPSGTCCIATATHVCYFDDVFSRPCHNQKLIGNEDGMPVIQRHLVVRSLGAIMAFVGAR